MTLFQESVVVSTNKNKTPSQLSHSYLILELSEKLEVLHAFIKSHLNTKILVFMSSCKQVISHISFLSFKVIQTVIWLPGNLPCQVQERLVYTMGVQSLRHACSLSSHYLIKLN